MNSDAQPPARIVPPKRRRDKPILSCTLCRRRKLKCDRQQPCNSCVHRGLSLSCTYTPQQVSQAHKAPESVHERIDQLEKLVTSLMNEKAKKEEDPIAESRPSSSRDLSEDSTDGEVTGTPDQVKVLGDTTSYSNSGHWSNILDGITELRDELERTASNDERTVSVEPDVPGPDLLFGRQRPTTKNEILVAIPPKPQADQLVNTFFKCMDMAPCVLHKHTFMRQYEQFWARPFDTSVMWLAVLFSCFATASRFQAIWKDQTEIPTLAGPLSDPLQSAQIDIYREKAAQCLMHANYTKCPPYTVEALLQYFLTEYFRSQDTQFGVWVLVAIIVRVALRMGYHRDPSRFSNITPFEGEMRRRNWVMIVQLDLMFSSQLGLPGMIHPSIYDVAEPRNLIDDDIYEAMTELPPSRPDTEPTVMMYTLVRNRVLQVFKRIADFANSVTSPAYRDVLSLDKELRAVYDNFPAPMKAIRVQDFDYSDSTSSRRRLFLGLSFLKAMLMLHRPYLLLGRTDPKYAYSRITCLETALEILQYQKTLDGEARPGGRLWNRNWQVWAASWRKSSVINHDFLLATTVLALDLDRSLTSSIPTPQEEVVNNDETPTQAAIIETLQGAYKLWADQSETSREAKKVAAAVRLVLRKANALGDDDPASFDPETPMSLDFAGFAPGGNQNFSFPDAGTMFYDFDNTQHGADFLNEGLFVNTPIAPWGSGMGTGDAAPPLYHMGNNFLG